MRGLKLPQTLFLSGSERIAPLKEFDNDPKSSSYGLPVFDSSFRSLRQVMARAMEDYTPLSRGDEVHIELSPKVVPPAAPEVAYKYYRDIPDERCRCIPILIEDD